ncbi:MAG: hypothetical protein JKY56_27005 [Kofleriaceae bacterium]|nr:hypothetical protein [Kofleriaceae bacterium]
MSPSPVEEPPEPIDNRAPIAISSPGSDYPIGSTVTLSGLGSFDPDGDPLLFRWSADIPGMPDPLEGTASEFTLELQNEGPYLVDLSVEDPFGSTSSTSLIVRALIPAAITEVDSGPNGEVPIFQQVTVQGSVALFGTDETSYSWRFLRTPLRSAAQLADTDTLEPSFLADRVGEYLIELRVDSLGATFKSTISVIAMASRFEPDKRFIDFDYSPAVGKFAGVSFAGNGKFQILDPSNWSAIDLMFPRPYNIAFTPDGTQLVVGHGTSLSATPYSIAQLDTSSGSVLRTTLVSSNPGFDTAANEHIVFSDSTSATTLNLTNQLMRSASGTLGSSLVAATNASNKFYTWENNSPGHIGRLEVTSSGPVFLGSHQLAAGDCNPLWPSPTEQFVISACGKILRVSDNETLDLSGIGDLSVTAIEAAVHATTLGLIIVATAEGNEFALRAFNDVTFEEEWVRVLPDWYTGDDSGHVRVLTPRALYILPDGQTLLMVAHQSSFGPDYLLRFKL